MPLDGIRFRALLVDASEAFLHVAGEWIARQPSLELVGVAKTSREAIAIADQLRPDLVLIDVGMPDIDGFEATRRLKLSASARWVVVLSFFDSMAAREEAWAAGADRFVSKAEFAKQMPEVLRQLAGTSRSSRTAEPASRANEEPSP